MRSFARCACWALVASVCSSFKVQAEEPLRIRWSDEHLRIAAPWLPGGELDVHYLEAFCRAGSTDRDWGETVIPHQTQLLATTPDESQLVLRSVLEDGLRVTHVIRAGQDEVDFRLTVYNPTSRLSEAHWAQPCIQVAAFTGADQEHYVPKCFVFLDGELARLPTTPWATQARYVPGQVYCPRHVPRDDVNPRPLSELVPSSGLVGCFSADEQQIMACAWEPYQELFQGVRTCIHADFRLGGVPAGATQQIRGKLYVVPADVPALVARYERDFPEQATE